MKDYDWLLLLWIFLFIYPVVDLLFVTEF